MMRPGVRTIGGLCLISVILFGGLALSSAQVADAHAVLESSTPADQSVLAHSPPRMTLTFGEPVTLVVGSLRVFDPSGKRVDQGVPKHGHTDAQVTVGLKPDLAAGSYAVAWRVISADTHPVHGGLVFSVERSGSVGSLNQYLSQSSQPGWEAAGDVLRGISYLAGFIVVGASVFAAFIERKSVMPRRRTKMLTIVGAIAVIAEVLQLPVSATLGTGEGPGSIFSSDVAGQVLGQGTWITIAGVALAVVAALATFTVKPRARRWLAAAAVLLLAGALVASGHSRSTDPPWLVSLVDAVHVGAATIWVGGLAMLVGSTWGRFRQRSDPEAAAAEVAGFSRVATVAIVAVGAAGVTLAWFEVGSWRGLFTTGYGQLVIVKVALIIVLASLGGFNQFRLLPVLRRQSDHAGAWNYLRRTLRAEAIAMVAVLAVTGVLVSAIPSRTELSQQALYSSTAKFGSGTANLVIDPARTGPIALHIYLLDAHGRADNSNRSAEAELYQSKLQIGPIDHSLHRAGPGHYLTNGTLFTVAGDWTVTIQVRVDEFTERSAVFKVHIRS